MLNRYGSALVFLATMVGGGSLLLSPTMQAGALHSFTEFITAISNAALAAFGFTVDHDPQRLFTLDRSFVMGIGNDCNGAWAHLIFLASVLAYPATWKEKLFGLAVGEPLIFALNVFRVVSLFVIGVYAPTFFRAAHVYVWQFLIIGLALLLFFIWVDRFVSRPA